jgi:transposase-like protein
MKQSRFTDEHEAGATVAEVCRKHRMSSATFDVWNASMADGRLVG